MPEVPPSTDASNKSNAFPIEQWSNHLKVLYPDLDATQLANKIAAAVQPFCCRDRKPVELSQSHVMLISYGDSILGGSRRPLENLRHFVADTCGGAITCLHILPFFPYSSDDGFSIIDYYQVREDLGNWTDIARLGEACQLMMDLVVNHASAESEWFKSYCDGELDDFFVEATIADDLSQVMRPRTTPLLRPTETSKGIKQLWCTFSHDQVDVNFKNPQVLIEYLKIIGHYIQHGARILRLDAIGYLWKESGTTCIHLPQTHEAVRLMRSVCEYLAPGTMIITETNVPNHENLSYFGNRNEAHAIYNFSLPPLLVHSLLTGETRYLKQWMMSMPPAPDGCAYLNFTASHDGIGMRPAEGLLSDHEQHQLVETIRSFGGHFSTRRAADGSERVYELNIALFDALQGTVQGPDEYQIERFLCSQVVMLGVEGIPAFYIHSLLATPNDKVSLQQTGRARSINRHRWDIDDLSERLQDPESNQSMVLTELLRLVRIRREQPAFHPNATQFTLQSSDCFFAFWRQSRDRSQSIFAIHNMTNQVQSLRLATLNLIELDRWWDLISGCELTDLAAEISMQPYQCRWISNHR